MARKTMTAARKRRSRSSEQQQHVMALPATPQQEQQKIAASASASASAPAAVDAFLPCAHIATPRDCRSCHRPPSHAHGYKRRGREEIQNMRKWLHACKHIKEVPQLIEEMCKVLTMAGSSPEGNALASSYGSTCNLLFGAKESTSIQDLMDSLTNLSTWMDNVWPEVNAEYCVNQCLNDINCTNATERSGIFDKQNIIQSKVLTNPKDLCMLTSLQLEMMRKALCQSSTEMGERSNLDMGLFGHPCSSTLLNALLHSSHSSRKRKKSWVGNVSRKATNLVCPNMKGAFMGQKEYSTNSSKRDEVQTQSGLGADKEKLNNSDLRTTHQMSPDELERWIVKHSIPKKREHEIVLKTKNLEKIYKDCGRENHIRIEVDLSERDGFLLENEAVATDGIPNMLYVKHIMKTISLNRVNLDGQDEVIVLFKALRSDGREVIVDNAYLRSTYPLLLATFYEQNLRFLVGKSSSGKTQKRKMADLNWPLLEGFKVA